MSDHKYEQQHAVTGLRAQARTLGGSNSSDLLSRQRLADADTPQRTAPRSQFPLIPLLPAGQSQQFCSLFRSSSLPIPTTPLDPPAKHHYCIALQLCLFLLFASDAGCHLPLVS